MPRPAGAGGTMTRNAELERCRERLGQDIGDAVGHAECRLDDAVVTSAEAMMQPCETRFSLAVALARRADRLLPITPDLRSEAQCKAMAASQSIHRMVDPAISCPVCMAKRSAGEDAFRRHRTSTVAHCPCRRSRTAARDRRVMPLPTPAGLGRRARRLRRRQEQPARQR